MELREFATSSPCTNGFLVPVIKYPQKQLKRRLVLRHDLRRDTVPDGGEAWWQEWRWLVTRHVQPGSRGDGEDRGSAVSQLSAFLCSPGPYLWDGVVHIQGSSFFSLHLNHLDTPSQTCPHVCLQEIQNPVTLTPMISHHRPEPHTSAELVWWSSGGHHSNTERQCSQQNYSE